MSIPEHSIYKKKGKRKGLILNPFHTKSARVVEAEAVEHESLRDLYCVISNVVLRL